MTDLIVPLTLEQQDMAASLRLIRPDCVPGTNVIPDVHVRLAYYRICRKVAISLGLSNPSVRDPRSQMFYDACGIPD